MKLIKRCTLFALISSSLLWGAAVQAAPAERKLSSDEAKVKTLLEKKLPGAPQIKHVQKTNYLGGLYEVMLGGQLIYTDANANQILAGALYDLSRAPQMRNITDERMAELRRVDVAALPLNAAFKRVKGDGSRVLYLFSDIDCPFCERIERNLEDVNNVTIYTFLLPLDSLHPQAAHKSARIWCAKDRAKAWETYHSTKQLPDNKGDCETPIAKIQELAMANGINGTPGLVFADGQLVAGAVPAQMIEQVFSQIKK